MKAHEYVAIARQNLADRPLKSTIYKDVPKDQDGPAEELDVALDILRRLLSEVKTIADARKASSEAAILAIMLELKQKWRAICDRMNAERRHRCQPGHTGFTEEAFMGLTKIISEEAT